MWHIKRKRYIPAIWPIRTFWLWEDSVKVFGAETGRVLSVFDKGKYWAVYEEEKTVKNFGQHVSLYILHYFDDLEGFRSKGIESCKDTVDFLRDFTNKSKSLSIEDFVIFLDEFTKKHLDINKNNIMYWLVGDRYIEDLVKDRLKNLKGTEIDNIFHTMLISQSASYSQKIYSELWEIVGQAKKEGLESEIVSEKIKEFSSQYFWFPYEYVGPGIWDAETLKSLIGEKMNESKPFGLESDVSKRQKECIKKYDLSTELVKLFEILQELSLMQDDRKRYNSEISYYMNGIILPELGKRLGLGRDQSLYLDQELINLSQENREEFLERLKKRMDMMIEVSENGKIFWYEGREECKKYMDKIGLELENNFDSKEIKGQIANRGKYVGKERILRTSHVDDFKDGEIIVTGMTTPDFVQLMNKAGAIVTDEGGITCHAAIVSRELNKPCIISTKFATEVLKDGDLVEVDADKGIVKILGR